MRYFFLLIITSWCFSSCKEDVPKSTFEKILQTGSQDFRHVIDNKDMYEVQIMWTPITRTDSSTITEDHFFNFRPDEFFYPASTVKMPVAFLALQKLEELRKNGVDIDRNSTITIDSIRPPQSSASIDTTSDSGMASIGHYINKVFAISDNDAYNRLYEFTSQDYINGVLRTKKIFTNSRILHRVGVSRFSFDENRWTPSYNFLSDDNSLLFSGKSTLAQGMWINPISKTKKGIGYIDNNGQKINEPFDFGQKNFINIRDLQESLKRLVFPDLYPKQMTYNISEEDRNFVLESMSKRPKDHPYLEDHLDEYYDSYVKFFLFGDSKESIPDHIKIHNKVGYAYGYLTDCAYIHDTKEGIEYFLTATIHVNKNEIYNDGKYEYDEIGIPFLAELGRLVHQHMIDNKEEF